MDEFPDLAAILEYVFGGGDTNERGGGGLKSHSKLRRDTPYRSASNKTKMKDGHTALLALAPDNFTISLSCYNYTQSYKEGTFEARRNDNGRGGGVNACISLHKAPDTAPIKELVINIHWTLANINYILAEASLKERCGPKRNILTTHNYDHYYDHTPLSKNG